MADEIRFYRANEKPYGAFSNLYRREIEFEGERFATSEHAYQAGKPRKKAVRDWLLSAPSPALLAMAAHGLYYWDVAPGWSTGKFDRMRGVLRAKLSNIPIYVICYSRPAMPAWSKARRLTMRSIAFGAK